MQTTTRSLRLYTCLGAVAAAVALSVAPLSAAHASAARDMYDINGDGIVDAGVYDTNGNGISDVNIVDVDGNGVTDLFLLDANEDRRLDAAAYDTVGDGLPDTLDTDLDNDGLIEDRLVDTNGDHIPDLSVGAPNMILGPDGRITFLQTDTSFGATSDENLARAVNGWMGDVTDLLNRPHGPAPTVDVAGGWNPNVSVGRGMSSLGNIGTIAAGG